MSAEAVFLDALRSATGPSAAVYALLAIGLNMHFGYTGLLNFGQVGFMLVGAYGVAIAVATFGASVWVGIVLSIALAVVLALLLGAPTLRLRADYLAITTIAAAEILRIVFRSTSARPTTGGSYGLRGFADGFYAVNPIPPGDYRLLALPAGAVWLVLLVGAAALALWLLSRAARGRGSPAVQRMRLLRGVAIGALVGVVVGYGLPFANPIPPGRYRVITATVSQDRVWGLAVVLLAAACIAAVAWLRHTRGSLPPRQRRLLLAVSASAVAGALLARAVFAVNPLPPGQYGYTLLSFSGRRLWVLVVAWGLVTLACVLTWMLMRSPWGRVIKAVREDEDAARSLGKNVFSYKMQSLVLGGIAGALGGLMFSLTLQTVNPDTFLPQLTFYAYTALILGGAARVLGPVLGSVIFWFIVAGLDSFLRRAAGAGLLPAEYFGSGSLGALRFALVGLGLILLMIYRPQGILGSRREMQLDVT